MELRRQYYLLLMQIPWEMAVVICVLNKNNLTYVFKLFTEFRSHDFIDWLNFHWRLISPTIVAFTKTEWSWSFGNKDVHSMALSPTCGFPYGCYDRWWHRLEHYCKFRPASLSVSLLSSNVVVITQSIFAVETRALSNHDENRLFLWFNHSTFGPRLDVSSTPNYATHFSCGDCKLYPKDNAEISLTNSKFKISRTAINDFCTVFPWCMTH